MLSCKEVCHIVSESLDQKIPWHKRLKVKLHLAMCYACRRMVKQMGLLRKAARNYASANEKASPANLDTLSEEARNRIIKHLHQAKIDHTEDN